jgi:hypothetical protein
MSSGDSIFHKRRHLRSVSINPHIELSTSLGIAKIKIVRWRALSVTRVSRLSTVSHFDGDVSLARGVFEPSLELRTLAPAGHLTHVDHTSTGSLSGHRPRELWQFRRTSKRLWPQLRRRDSHRWNRYSGWRRWLTWRSWLSLKTTSHSFGKSHSRWTRIIEMFAPSWSSVTYSSNA